MVMVMGPGTAFIGKYTLIFESTLDLYMPPAAVTRNISGVDRGCTSPGGWDWWFAVGRAWYALVERCWLSSVGWLCVML